jgi:hypothetical protein|tara:strand:+ start:283 stop:531 length:249 start_codon:yes stop_codon:yes gene_type:complete
MEATMGEYLRARMRVCKVNQEDVVRDLRKKKLTVGRASVSRWCNGHTHPPRKVFPFLLDTLAIFGDERDRACRLFAGVSLEG